MVQNQGFNTARSRRILRAASLLLAVAALGCDRSQLETGYRYRPLGASDAQRRAYYAPEYSREATAAASDPAADMARRRPGTAGY